jgi:hypothetical protein
VGWKKLSSKIVYENDWMSVCEDRVINPGGGENLYGHVRFKNVAVAIIPVDDNDCTWLVGQDRYTLGEYSWEIPVDEAIQMAMTGAITDAISVAALLRLSAER